MHWGGLEAVMRRESGDGVRGEVPKARAHKDGAGGRTGRTWAETAQMWRNSRGSHFFRVRKE